MQGWLLLSLLLAPAMAWATPTLDEVDWGDAGGAPTVGVSVGSAPAGGAAVSAAASPAGSAAVSPASSSASPSQSIDQLRRAIGEALYEEVPLLGEQVVSARPAAEALGRMQAVVQLFPGHPLALRALGQAADNAGNDALAARSYADAASASGGAEWAVLALAGYQHQRLQIKEEVASLERVVGLRKARLASGGDRDGVAEIYRRILSLLEMQGAGAARLAPYYQAIIVLYPDQASHGRAYVERLLAMHEPARALAEVKRLRRLYPAEDRFFTRVEAQVALDRGGKGDAERALGLYEALLARDPVPEDDDDRYSEYFKLSKRLGRYRELRRDLEASARGGRIAGAELAKLFFLYSYEGESDKGRELLEKVRERDAEEEGKSGVAAGSGSSGGAGATAAATAGARGTVGGDPASAAKQALSEEELLLRGRLHLRARQTLFGLSSLYAAYQVAVKPQVRERALYEIGLALLDRQTLRSGLTPLPVLAALDPSRLGSAPSIPGGLASLLFIGADRGDLARALGRVETAYGNGLRAEAIWGELRRAFPRSLLAARLLARVVDSRREYKAHAEVVRLCDDFLRLYPRSEQYFQIGLHGAAARLSRKDAAGAAAAYLRLLAAADRRPGRADYQRVLSAYTTAMVGAGRHQDVVRTYWAEIRRRPEDRALFDGLLEFLGRNNLFAEQLRAYEEAIHRFPGGDFMSGLARWHLRHRGEAEFRNLAQSMIGTLDDESLARVLGQVISTPYGNVDSAQARFFEGIYLLALARFPHDLRFVRRLHDFYARFPTRFAVQRFRLALRYSLFDEELRQEVLRKLATEQRLRPELARVSKATGRRSIAETTLFLDAAIMLSQQEQALPLALSLAEGFPADIEYGKTAAMLLQSLARPGDRAPLDRAMRLLDALAGHHPANEELAISAGDLLAEAGRPGEAIKRWEAAAKLFPGEPKSYLRLASAYWDYFQYDRAAQVIASARKLLRDPLLYATELAAVYESKKDYAAAVPEYVRILAASIELGESLLKESEEGGGGDQGEGEGEGEREGEGEEEGEGCCGEEGDGGGSPVQGMGARTALTRLRFLAKRKRLGGAIDKAFAAAMAARPGDARPALAYGDYLKEVEREEARRKFLLEAVGRYLEPAFLERVVSDAESESWNDVRVAGLRALVGLAKGAPDTTLRLCETLEQAEQAAEADTEYRNLAAALTRGGEADREDLLAVQLRYAQFLERQGRKDDAIQAKLAAARTASGRERDRILYGVINELTKLGRDGEATTILDELRGRNPADTTYIDTQVDLLVRKGGDLAAVVAAYQAAMAAIRKLPLSDASKRDAILALREQLAGRLDKADRASEALDQKIEVLNRNLEQEEAVERIFRYAAGHALLPRLVRYYERAKKTSPKDARFPLVLARIAERNAEPARAAAEYAATLGLWPQRKDLWQARAQALTAAGDLDGAAAVYAKLVDLDDANPTWIEWWATLLGRAGKNAEAAKAVARLVAGDQPAPGPFFRAAVLCERLGMRGEALSYARRGLARLRANPYVEWLARGTLGDYLRIALRQGELRQAWDELRGLESFFRAETRREGNTNRYRADNGLEQVTETLEMTLPVRVRELGQDAMAGELAALLQKELAGAGNRRASYERLAEMAERAGLIDLGQEILTRGMAAVGNESDRRALEEQLWRRVSSSHPSLAKQLGLLDQWGQSGQSLTRLGQRATVQRASGDQAAELAALRAYVGALERERHSVSGFFNSDDSLLERYLQLSWRRGDRGELARLAAAGGGLSGQVARFYLRAGDKDLLVAAIEAAGREQAPLWKDVKGGVALTLLGDGSAPTLERFGRALGLGSIGELLLRLGGAKLDRSRELAGKGWYPVAGRYAAALALSGSSAQALRYARAAEEERPRNPQAYAVVGGFLLERKQATAAAGEYGRGLELAPRDRGLIDGLARAQLAGGERAKALASWRRIIEPPKGKASDDDHRFHFRALRRAGLEAEARAALGQHLSSRYARADVAEAGFLDDLTLLAQASPACAPGSELERFLGSLLASKRRLWLLARIVGLDGEALCTGAAADGYFRAGMAEAATLPALLRAEQLGRWESAYGSYLLAGKRFAEAKALAEASLGRTTAGEQPPRWAVFCRGRALAGLGDGRGTMAAFETRCQKSRDLSDYQEAAKALRDAGFAREGHQMLAAYYRHALDTGRDSSGAHFVGLAEQQLHLGQRAEALDTLRRLRLMLPEGVEALEGAARLLADWQLFADALAMRRAIALVVPESTHNRAQLARCTAHAGDRDRGVAMALELLADRAVERSGRKEAAEVLLDLGRSFKRSSRIAGQVRDLERSLPYDGERTLAAAALYQQDQELSAARGVLRSALGRAVLPGAIHLELGKVEEADKNPQPALAAFTSAWYYLGTTPLIRLGRFHGLRALGQHEAAVLALRDQSSQGYIDSLSSGQSGKWADERRGRAVREEIEMLRVLKHDVPAVLAAAADSAARAEDVLAQIFYGDARAVSLAGKAGEQEARAVVGELGKRFFEERKRRARLTLSFNLEQLP